MDRRNIKIDGIYDKRTFLKLKELKITSFGFDFNPRSLNFIQEYVFLNEILPNIDYGEKIFLYFENSSDSMIKKLYADLVDRHIDLENFFLEIGNIDSDLNFPLRAYVNAKDIEKIEKNENIIGLFFRHSYFKDLYLSGRLTNFFNKFSRIQSNLFYNSSVELKLNFDEKLESDFVRIIDHNLESYKINGSVELCYRNVNFSKLISEISALS